MRRHSITEAPLPNMGPTTSELLHNPTIQNLIAVSGIADFISTTFTVVFPLFCFSPIADGGLSFSVGLR
jgi:hypothetical protein